MKVKAMGFLKAMSSHNISPLPSSIATTQSRALWPPWNHLLPEDLGAKSKSHLDWILNELIPSTMLFFTFSFQDIDSIH
jgi:hypothetical protein